MTATLLPTMPMPTTHSKNSNKLDPRKLSNREPLLSPEGLAEVDARSRAKEVLRERLRPTFEALTQHKKEVRRKSFSERALARVTPEFVFGALHCWAIVTLVYGMSWTIVAISNAELPASIFWKPMKLFKLSYPMLPVILGSWICRSKFNNGSRMSSGYYFSNLKMGLLPSLGPGMIIGVVFDKLVIRPQYEPFHVQEEFRKVMVSFAWLSGFFLWAIIQTCMSPNEETRREDWGMYSRWYLQPHSGFGSNRKLNPLSEWVHKGPHLFLGVIPTPQHGTFHKVLQANKARSIGITICSIAMWFFLLVWWCVLSEDAWRQWWTSLVSDSVTQMMILTDVPNLFFNTLTAPYLIYDTWRKEPAVQNSSDLQHVYDSEWGQSSRISQPPLLQEPSEEAEIRLLFDELVAHVMNLPLNDIMKLKELRDIVQLSGQGRVQRSLNADTVCRKSSFVEEDVTAVLASSVRAKTR